MERRFAGTRRFAPQRGRGARRLQESFQALSLGWRERGAQVRRSHSRREMRAISAAMAPNSQKIFHF